MVFEVGDVPVWMGFGVVENSRGCIFWRQAFFYAVASCRDSACRVLRSNRARTRQAESLQDATASRND